MAIRVGTDLASAAAVRETADRHGGRYLERIYTAAELADCAGARAALDFDRLAARWAAKEATIKVLRPGPRDAVPWRSVELARTPSGAPRVRLHGPARALAQRAGIAGLEVSVAHEAGVASAVVLAEVTGSERPR